MIVQILIGLLLVICIIAFVAARLNVPPSILLVLAGVGLALVPGLPRVELAPDVAKYHAILARSLAAVPPYRPDAVRHFERAIELDPWNTSTYFQFAELYELMQLPWRAVMLYQKILQIDPEHTKANERLAQLEALQQQEKRSKQPLRFVSRIFQRKS